MKNVKRFKIFALIAALALIIGAYAVITASAEGECALEVENANVAYNDMLQLVFTLKNVDTIPSGAEAGILMWNEAKNEYTAKNAKYSDFTTDIDNGVKYYKTPGIAAADIGTTYYFAVAYKLDGEVTIVGEIFEYSIAKYVASRLDDADVTANQKELYDNILAYGLASDSVLDADDTYAVIKTVIDGASATDVSFGEAFTTTAPEIEGKTFAGWYLDGVLISEDATLTLEKVELGKIVTYVAKYN